MYNWQENIFLLASDFIHSSNCVFHRIERLNDDVKTLLHLFSHFQGKFIEYNCTIIVFKCLLHFSQINLYRFCQTDQNCSVNQLFFPFKTWLIFVYIKIFYMNIYFLLIIYSLILGSQNVDFLATWAEITH